MKCQLCNNRCFSRPWLFSTPQMVFFLYFAIFSGKIDNTQFITARKRSLGQGNMFTGVCLSTGGCLVPVGGVWSRVGAWSRGACSGGCLHLGGVPARGGSGPRGVSGGDPPLLRTVRILLECILIYFCFPSS